jgi:alpha/beta superfamily hydrolase
VPGSEQVAIPGAGHFYEDREDALVKAIVPFLDRSLQAAGSNADK